MSARSYALIQRKPPTLLYFTWYAAANAYQALAASQQQPRADGVLLQRVRLGYSTREKLYDGFSGQECGHCGRHDRQPLLLHYLLSCPATAVLRPARSPSAQPDNGGLVTRRETSAALLVRYTSVDVMLQVLRAVPPPHRPPLAEGVPDRASARLKHTRSRHGAIAKRKLFSHHRRADARIV